MRFGITESKSESIAMQVLAATLEENRNELTAAANDLISIDRKLNLDAEETDLESLRQNYFDALVAFDTTSPESIDALAKASYNAARLTEGLSPIN